MAVMAKASCSAGRILKLLNDKAMSLLTKMVSRALSGRLRSIERFMRHPVAVQHEQFTLLAGTLARIPIGASCGIGSVCDYEGFARSLPVRDYDQLRPFVDRIRAGEGNLLWDSPVRWYAKSSGTTSDRSKYIPITARSLHRCHYRGGKDVLALYLRNNPRSRIFSGKTMTLGGSRRLETEDGAPTGDLSAILISNTPFYAGFSRTPSADVALIPDFETKVEAICRRCTRERVTAFAGVPSWNLVLLNRVLEYCGKDNILQVWPHMELFMHGGVSFLPYRDVYRRLIPSDGMHYMETYNASEGFFAMQDDPADDSMLLMLDYEIFYEFLPVTELDHPEKAVPLEGVEKGVNYAMIITTSGGLWRYMIGDTVTFTSTDPYKIKITGRTRQYINAFGEELMVDNAERAIQCAAAATGSDVAEYTAAPVFMEADTKGSHEWLVEFKRPPADMALFAEELDKALRRLNSDYDAKRSGDTTLYPPRVEVLPEGTFYRWMSSRGKLGGQNKIPRLSPTRDYVEALHKIVER